MYWYSTVSIQLKILLFSFRKTRISKFFFSRFRLPAVSIPQREKMRSTYASDAGADNTSNASGARLWYIAMTIHPKLLAIGSSIIHVTGAPSCICSAALEAMDPACCRHVSWWVLVILAARNVNFCSTGVLTEEVLAVVESELSVATCWLGLFHCLLNHIQLSGMKKTSQLRC